MQDEITARPLVDILSEQLGEPVVMSGDNYVLLGNKSVVAITAVDLAVATQQNELLRATADKVLADAKQAKLEALANLTVTTTAGNTFDADDAGRASMNEAIAASGILGLTESNWKLADNTVKLITLDELKEALALGIQAKGAIILG